MSTRFKALAFTCAIASIHAGCGQDSAATFTWPANTDAAVANYAAIVHANYEDSLADAENLGGALGALVADPTTATLGTAREAWLASRESYLQTEVFRFYDGPIDNPTDGPEGLINAWPLDEHYIDYVEGDEAAGMINGTQVIDAAALEAANEAGGEKNIATGYHAIEFLLWGQDHDDAGPGARPATDYMTDGSGTAANQDRRGTYLTVAGDLLTTHLTQVRDGWTADAAYRSEFESDSEAAFAKILTGMIILSGFETGGERLQAALDSGNQEDEHSCFSDNTHRDMVQDVRGVQNVWRGTYTRTDGETISGPGIRDVVEAADPALAAEVDTQIDTSLELAEALHAPFDQEIAPGSDGNARVQALVQSLQTQEQLLFDVFETFELTVTIPE